MCFPPVRCQFSEPSARAQMTEMSVGVAHPMDLPPWMLALLWLTLWGVVLHVWWGAKLAVRCLSCCCRPQDISGPVPRPADGRPSLGSQTLSGSSKLGALVCAAAEPERRKHADTGEKKVNQQEMDLWQEPLEIADSPPRRRARRFAELTVDPFRRRGEEVEGLDGQGEEGNDGEKL